MWGTEMSFKKMNKQFSYIFIATLALMAVSANAVPTLEIGNSPASGTNVNGPTFGPLTYTYRFDEKNPSSGSHSDNYFPKITVSYKVENVQYTTGTAVNQSGLVMGGTSVASGSTVNAASTFRVLNEVGSAAWSDFSSNAKDIGVGIDSTNYGTAFFINVRTLQNKVYLQRTSSSLGYYMGDVVMTFNRPVKNPILSLSGMGSALAGNRVEVDSTVGFTANFELSNPPAGVSVERLSGRDFAVDGNKIYNSYNGQYNITTGSGGASGSVRIKTENAITELRIKVYVASNKSTGNYPASAVSGDGFAFSMSSIDSMVGDLLIEKTNNATQVAKGSNTTYTVRVTNKGPDTFTGTFLNDRLAQGLELVKVECSTATNNKCTDSSKIDPAKLFVSDAELTSAVNTGQDTGSLAKDAFYEVLVTAKVIGDVDTNTINKASVKLPTMGSSTGVSCKAQTGLGGSTGLTRTFNETTGICLVTDTDTIIKPQVDLVVVKTAEKTSYKVGDLVKYTVKAWNEGPSEVTDAIVKDVVPNSLASVQMITCQNYGKAVCPRLSTNSGINNTLATPAFTLPVSSKDTNQKIADYLEFTVSGLAYKTGAVENTAVISSAIANEVNTANNLSKVKVDVLNDAPINTGNTNNQCNGNQSVNLITDPAFKSYINNNVLEQIPYTPDPAVVPYSIVYGTGPNGALELKGKINWSYGNPRITGSTLKISVNGTVYAVLVTPGASANNDATFTALGGASVTPSSFVVDSFRTEPSTINFTLTLPTTLTSSVTGLNVEFQNISPRNSASDAGDDIGFSLNSLNACLKPTVELKKISTSGTGSFEFDSFSNLSANTSYQIQSGEVVTTVTGAPQSIRLKNSSSATEAGFITPVYANAGQAVLFKEKIDALYSLRSVTCLDSNATNSGNSSSALNATLSGNSVTISKDNLKFGARLVCTVTNEKKAGYVFSGRVFNDNSGSTKDASKAYNAIVDAGEVGIAGSQIELQNCTTKAVLASAVTNANGDFSIQTLQEVFDANSNVCLVQKNVADYQSVTITKPASITATTDASFDLFTITKSTNLNTYEGFLFGDAQLQLILTQNGQKNIVAGDVVEYPHEIVSKSVHKLGGLSPSNQQQPATDPAWQSIIYYDANCNGAVDTGEKPYDVALQSTPLSAPILPEQKICLVQRVISPSNAKAGDSLSAQFAVKHTPTVSGSSEKQSNTVRDVTAVGSAGLDMVKSVREVKSCPSTATDTAAFVKNNILTKAQNKVSYLEYQISYTNNSTKTLVDLTLKDAVPLGTSLKSMCTENNCNGVSNTTPLNWNIAGVLAPRLAGTVRFCVEVQ